jgi:general secretion pathway protein J
VNGLPAFGSYKAKFQSTARQSGVTLLELLIVIAVFSIMSAAAYSGLQSSLKAEENFSASMKDLEAVQMSLTLFQRDVTQLSPRGIRDAYGDDEAAIILINGREFFFTRGGNFSSLKLDQTELIRVGYSLQGEELIRSHWRQLDSTQGERPLRASLLDKVSNLQIRVLDLNNVWHLDWPLSTNGNIRAVELTIELEGWGEIRRLLPVPG